MPDRKAICQILRIWAAEATGATLDRTEGRWDTGLMNDIRPAEPADLAPLARLWYAGWHEAHAAIVPADLTAQRTEASFLNRLENLGDALRTAGPVGKPLGFCAIKGDELYQLFVSPDARGTGLARDLLTDGEARLAARGVARACLLCADGNDRAARFYARAGWTNLGLRRESVDTASGPFFFEVLRFEKDLSTARQPS